MSVSRNIVMITAALVWYGGGVALFLKAGSLLGQARALQADSTLLYLIPVLGIAIGLIKTKFIFAHACTKNIARIRALARPRIWQCFRPGMLLFLAIIIPTGALMSRMADGKFGWLCTVAALDLSIGTALLASGVLFWTRGAFRAQPE